MFQSLRGEKKIKEAESSFIVMLYFYGTIGKRTFAESLFSEELTSLIAKLES